MRNIMQLVGGVVVAGAVAAGSTAFTAAGLSSDTSFTKVVGGGKLSFTVEGAVIDYVTMISDPADADHISGAEFTLSGANSAVFDNTKAVVTATITGGTATGTPTLSCAYAASKWTCVTSDPTTKYWAAPTGLTISVQGATT